MMENFKNMVRPGEKLIMVENGKPSVVIMSYADYENMLKRNQPEFGFVDEKTASDGRSGIGEAEREFNAKLVMDSPNLPEDISKIRLEDLPL